MTTTQRVKQVSKFAVPFLGFLAAVQGAAPNIASTALVGASRSLEMTGSTLALAASLQTLAIAATAISTGLLADRLGRRRVLMAALIAGAVGNLVVLASPTAAIYMLGMAIIGVGLGAVYGCAFGYLSAVVPAEKMASAMGVFVAVIMASTLVLTFVGGNLASANWRLAYTLIPAMCVLCLVLTPLVLPAIDRVKGGKLDLPGQALLMVGIVAVVYSMSQLAHSLTSPNTLVPLALGIVLLIGFFVRESTYPGRFFPVSLFRSRVFLAAICAGFIYNFGSAVAFLQATNLWQYVNGLQTAKIALWQLPLGVSGIIAGLVIGRAMTKGLSSRGAILLGGTSAALGFGWLAAFNTATGFLGFLPGLVLLGAGVAIASVPFGSLILRAAPPADLGAVSSSRLTFGQLFYTMGLALSTVTIDRLTTGGVVDRLQHAGVPPTQLSTGIDALTAYASKGTTPNTPLGKEALQDAVVSYGHAFATMMFIAGGATLVVAITAWFLLAGDQKTATATTESPAPPVPREAPVAPVPVGAGHAG